MPATAHSNPPAAAAPRLAQLCISGADARSYLQGQLSNDMELLAADRMLAAGLHSPQGRVLALLQLCAPAAELVVALLPEDLAATAAAALSRFVLRARVQIAVAAADHVLCALPGAPASTVAGRISDLARGLPQVYAASSGQFIAQMLNLDVLHAIAFDKGCYTGQEVIARAHYRGRVKRRMQRFTTDGDLGLPPGATLRLADGRSAQLVDSVLLADGRCEFLAVAPWPPAPEPAPAAPDDADYRARPPLIECRPLPLPYALPA